MTYTLGKRSLDNLVGVHPDLVKVVKRAIEITKVDFTVTDGLRTKEEQAKYVAEGKSRTMNSRHLTGHAVDLAAWADGTVSWKEDYYDDIADAMFTAAEELRTTVSWGGNWPTFKDLVHFELPRAAYPV